MNMSTPRPKPVAEINLEEFERRLRASVAPQAGVEDPLAELTRLVDTIGLERSPSERALDYGRTPRPAPAPQPVVEARPPAPAPAPVMRAPPPAPVVRAPPAPMVELRAPPAVELREPPPPPPPAAFELEPFDFEETEPEVAQAPPAPPPLRDVEPLLRPALDPEDLEALMFEPQAAAASGETVAPRPGAARVAGTPRPRNWGLKVGGLLAAAAVMAGAVVVFKVGGHSHSGAPPLILASTAPTKVAPPSDDTVRTDNESGSLLTHDTAQAKATAPKLVDTPEAPVDLSARPTNSQAAPTTGDASPVAPANDTQIVATTTPAASPMSPVGSDPNRVKTISVRPDGTLISSSYQSTDAASAPAAPAPAPTVAAEKPPVAAADADTEASSPAVALPTKLSPPKSGARVVGKTDTTAPADAGAGPVTPKPKKPKAKPTPVADADAAKTDDAQAPAPASGGYAVQLAAPRSADEAKAQIHSLQSKYADALGGASLGVRKADRNGDTIYRVRAGGLSKADAVAMCSKIKSTGGDCFVAKN
jgi:hypothetical protein